MIVVRLDGIGREVKLEETAAEVVRHELDRRDADMKSVTDRWDQLKKDMAGKQEEMDALRGKMDEAMSMLERLKGEKAASEEKAKEDAKRADAAEAVLKDTTKLREILAPRVALETAARQWLPDDQHARIDAMKDDEIRRSVTKTLLPGLEISDDVSGDRLDGMYRTALATRQTRRDSAPPPKDSGAPNPQTGGRYDSRSAQEERIDSEYVPPGRGRAA